MVGIELYMAVANHGESSIISILSCHTRRFMMLSSVIMIDCGLGINLHMMVIDSADGLKSFDSTISITDSH